MEAYLLDWLNLLGRWVHLLTGVAWIGASFYFVWLDNHLVDPASPADRERGVGGEVWAVHGGGFYHAQKYRVAPPELPAALHWFKWEAYSTWLSGIFLLALIYWYGAAVYLIDPAVADIGRGPAVAIGVATVVLGWLVYDGLCRSPLGRNETALGWALFVLLSLAAFGLCSVFSGRGAYIHFGAMLGTIMVANVFFVIIPGQKELVTAKGEGRRPDPIHGERGKQRSVHNTYFTLPVLFVMISNHYAMTYGHRYNWLILIALSLAGALARFWFVARHKGPAPLWPLLASSLLVLAVVVALVPGTVTGTRVTSADSRPTLEDVQSIVASRCAGCHARQPTQPGFSAPPKGLVLESAEQIRAQAEPIHQQTVVTKVMPIGNLTGMTDDERAVIDRWYRSLDGG
jgi:uncharacterized membrane protein